MQVPQIRLQQTFAKLGLQITRPVQEIQQPRAELNLHQEPAVLEIRQPRGVLTMDTSEAQANIDLRGPLRRSRDNAEYGYQKAMEAIAQISEEGDRLRAIENKGNPIADIAFEESVIYHNTEIIAEGSLVGDGVEIHYEARRPEINVQIGGVQMNPEIKRPIHNYTPGKVEGYIRQWNSLKIDFVGLNVDRKL
ncbi:hypothetical protein FOI68_16530 [Brevibacillus sp. LEMMJ03]|uniref:DUF6470 family protein n=1 Tax=Brevibacillus sp. LEMMJ03 TaxID=2595056 RepID=UPI0011814F09|nr:DUF6470 family protein [Brevibacillus sp. LEMMJ03]TRY24500.1 hypothetical protein FOI68_16530 [Brevibacillus sp. LEMMJ03]